MALRAHTIKPSPDSKEKKRRVGRGNGSGRGTYSGRGIKGQRARSGGKSKTFFRGIKDDIKKIPKLGGFTSHKKDKEVVNLEILGDKFEEGEEVSPWTLKEKGLVSKPTRGVKILGRGELEKKLVFVNCDASESARKSIESAGGEIKSE